MPFFPPNTDGVWYTWTPDDGALTVSLADGRPIGSIWFPAPPLDTMFALPDEAAFYTIAQEGPELVPMPALAPSIVVSASGATAVAVYATALRYTPFKEVSVTRYFDDGQTSAPGDGSAVITVPFSFVFPGTPRVVATVINNSGAVSVAPYPSAISTTQFSLTCYGGTSADVTVDWVATYAGGS